MRWWRTVKLAGDFLSRSRQPDAAVGIHPHQSVFLQTAHRHRHGRRRNLEPVRQSSRNDGFAFALSLENRFEVVLFGDRDHVRSIIRRD